MRMAERPGTVRQRQRELRGTHGPAACASETGNEPIMSSYPVLGGLCCKSRQSHTFLLFNLIQKQHSERQSRVYSIHLS
jgi:hypothetical protein